MITSRHFAFTAILALAGAQPALAESCHVTVRGRLLVDDEPCQVARRRGAVMIGQDGIVLATIRRGTLAANLPDPSGPAPYTGRRHRLKSYGAVVASDNRDDKLCYFNQTITFCLER